MTLTLSDIQSGFTVELFGAQQVGNDRNGAVNATPTIGFESQDAYLTSLEQQSETTIQGAVTALRLSRDPEYSSDPRTALAEWVADFDAMMNGAPGDGFELTQDYRDGRTFQGYLSTLQWTLTGGEALSVGYSLEFARGQGFGTYEPPDPVSVSVTDTWRVAGRELAYIDEFASQKNMEIDVARRTFADSPDENDIITTTGATRELTATGTVVGTAAERNQFATDITATLGQDTLITVEEGLTGQSFEGMVSSFTETDESGRPRDNDFSLTVVEGTE